MYVHAYIAEERVLTTKIGIYLHLTYVLNGANTHFCKILLNRVFLIRKMCHTLCSNFHNQFHTYNISGFKRSIFFYLYNCIINMNSLKLTNQFIEKLQILSRSKKFSGYFYLL